MTNDWQAAPGSPSSFLVKRILRLDIPVGNYPNVSCVCYSVVLLYLPAFILRVILPTY